MNNQSKPLSKRALPAIAALAATLLSLPVSSVMAQSFPQYPLQTGAGNVEPNLLFILDDSGSMAEAEMPNPDLPTICRRTNNSDSCAGSGGQQFNITDNTYTGNTLMYNPATSYQTWLQSDGTRMTGGTSFGAAYSSNNLASGGTVNLAGSTRTFYVPKDPSSTDNSNYLRNATNYWRYEFRTINGTQYVVRSELKNLAGFSYGDFPPTVTPIVVDEELDRWDNEDFNNNETQNFTFTMPSGVIRVEVNTSANNNNNGNAQLYLQRNTGGSTWVDQCTGANATASGSRTNNESCVVNDPVAGSWRVRIVNALNQNINNLDIEVNIRYNGTNTTYQDSGCTAPTGSNLAWSDCTVQPATFPNTTRSLAEEQTNFAIWYSYHRTRMKIAKAGAAEAFHALDDSVRVGYRTIHDVNNLDIPVNTNRGVFSGANRTSWFAKLFAATDTGYTPLRSALRSAGEYFSQSASTGPYGPESGADQYACRQNFAILTTDGFWNTNDEVAFTMGDVDGVSGSAIINHSLPSTDPNYNIIRYTRSAPYQDSANAGTNYNKTLADVAMHYWKRDLRTDLDNIVPVADSRAAFWQHMVTFGISIGLKGSVDQTSVAQVLQDNGPRIGGFPVSWPNPISNSGEERIDDLLHAAVNGHGEFIAATSADRFRDALVGVLGQIQSRLASGSNVATNSATFLAGAKMFQATYRTGQWTGDVIARDVTEAGISSTELWRATTRIAAAGASHKDRTVLTWSGTAGAAFPTANQTTALERATGLAPVTGANNAAYIRGDQTNEQANGGVLRNRVTVLGDIVNSSPFYAADSETIYVGANDGMLHAFDADNGNTLFSYLPAGVNLSALAGISDPAYGHSFFMDGPITISGDRVVADTNYLVGTLGRGGKGAFALNVTTPGTMDAGDVLWDHTAANDADMGYIIGIPMIVKGNNDELLALVPNGIDSTNGGAHLYIYDVTDGTLIRKLSTGVTGGNGLSAPRANDRNADQKVDYVYAGDLLGNVWKFDLSSADPAEWAVDLGGLPLFTATDEDGNPQPITGGLALARDAATDTRFVTFGTGRLIQTSDLNSTAVQSMYGIIDDDAPIDSRDDLEVNTIAVVWEDADGVTRRAFENYQALPATAKGWVVDLDDPTPGERVIGGAQVNGRAAIMSSVIPSAGDGCEADGSGFLNAIDVFTGTSPEATGGGGATTSFFDTTGGNSQTVVVNGVTYSTGSIDMGVGLHGDGGLVNNGSAIVVCGSDATCEDEDLGEPEGGAPEPRRTSWRELFGED